MIYSSKLFQYKNILHELGHVFNFVVIPPITHKVCNNFYIENELFTINTFVVEHASKYNFVYYQFANRCAEKDQVVSMLTKLDAPSHNIVYEVEWHTVYKRYPKEYSKNNRKHILYQYINQAKTMLKEGFNDIKPEVGAIVAGYPHGYKIDLGPGFYSTSVGIKNREYLCRYVNLSKKDVYGWCYGIYNEDLKLTPL